MDTTKKQMHIYCTDDMRNKLEILAATNRRSMSSEIQVLIEKAFEDLTKNNLKR